MARKNGKDALREAQAAFNRAPMREPTSKVLARKPGNKIGPSIPASRGVQNMPVNTPTATRVVQANAVGAPVRGAARSPRIQGTNIPASRGIQTLAPPSTAMTAQPRSALDTSSGNMTSRMNERLAKRIAASFESQPSRPTAINVSANLRRLPAPGDFTVSSAATGSAGAARAPRRAPRGRGVAGAIGNVAGAYAVGLGAATPDALMAAKRQRDKNK